MSKKIAVIPAFEPDTGLLKLLAALSDKAVFSSIIVVNDGSSEKCNPIFEKAEQTSTVLYHESNKGKGAALKTAFSYIENNIGEDCTIVTADADGQHNIDDIIHVCCQASEVSECIVMGSRNFNKETPFRSRFGNSVTRTVFRIASGYRIYDTQTGLRAFSGTLLPYMLSVEGERYEYEMNMLLNARDSKITVTEIPIDTIYEEGNKSSHFNPFKDSFKIYKSIIKFSCSSLLAFIIDFFLFTLLTFLMRSFDDTFAIFFSNIFARTVSSTANFFINKKVVFKSSENTVAAAIKYFILVVVIISLNTLLLTFLVTNIWDNKLGCKVIVEISLFILSFTVQRFIIFKKS